ncbi:hypothetical protein PsYK624_058590 [Phanerochaete sordida]|uniref:Uncharacterized protein n=1 Tax=Phanerochaete sordida TaxID=48140 RepID=A0A9P3G7J4_9APHY|nr:hypothetical protein PsYK624_058590 [Phanerochaete sordida]
MAHSCASAVYAEQLVSRGYGLPLWRPEPANPMDEVEIGDVGYVSEGEFIRLFNAMRPADDPLNADGVPSGFVILQPSARLLRSDEHHLPPGPVCTTTTTYRQASGELEASSIVGASYTFTCKSSHGAVAVLGDSGHQKWYLRNVKFREYIVKHHASWYAFAIEREHDIAPGSLVLVSGWLKTSEWALATFANHGKTHDVSLSASAGSYASAAFTAAAGTEVAMSVEQRCGPQRTRTADGKLPRGKRYLYAPKRQTCKVHGTKAYPAEHGAGRLEPSDEDCEIYEAGDTSGGSMEIEEMPSVSDRTAAVDSVDIILDYLMEPCPLFPSTETAPVTFKRHRSLA